MKGTSDADECAEKCAKRDDAVDISAVNDCICFFIVAPCIVESMNCSLTNKCTFY